MKLTKMASAYRPIEAARGSLASLSISSGRLWACEQHWVREGRALPASVSSCDWLWTPPATLQWHQFNGRARSDQWPLHDTNSLVKWTWNSSWNQPWLLDNRTLKENNTQQKNSCFELVKKWCSVRAFRNVKTIKRVSYTTAAGFFLRNWGS